MQLPTYWRNNSRFAANLRLNNSFVSTFAQLALAMFSQSANAAPSIAVTYAPSQTPLVVGQAGQHYKLNIQVSGGPVVGGVALLGALPAGVVTSGSISASGGSLAACEAVRVDYFAAASLELNRGLVCPFALRKF